MGSNAGPKIPQYEKLVFHIDAYNTRSHPGSGNTWYDISQAGISGTVVGTASFASGGATASVVFNASTYYNFGSPTSLDITPSITMNCIWLNRGWNKSWQTLISKGDHSFRISRSSAVASNGWYATGQDPNVYWNSGIATSHEYDAWKMVTASFNPTTTTVKFYINGIGVSLDTTATRNASLATTTAPFWVGANFEQSNRQLNGNVAVVQLFNGVLSDFEVQDLYASYKGRYGLT